MKNHTGSVIAMYALLILSAPLLLSNVANVEAINCPVGYTCTPIPRVANCPSGYICTPRTSVISAPQSSLPLSASCSAVRYGTSGLTWSADVVGGRAPYLYSWSIYSHGVSANVNGSLRSQVFTSNYPSSGIKQASVRVTDSSGRSVSASCSFTIPTTAPATTQAPAVTSTPVPTPQSSVPLSASCSAALNGTPYLTWSAEVVGGRAPYTYSWSIYNYGTSVNAGGSLRSQIFTAKYPSSGLKQAAVRVTDSSGRSVSASCSFTIPTTAPATTPAPAATQALRNGITYENFPASVYVGQVINVTVKNSGTKSWGASHDIGLSTKDLSTNIQFVNLGPTLPGNPANVSFTAPSVPGSYVLRALEQNVEWFGTNQVITVLAK